MSIKVFKSPNFDSSNRAYQTASLSFIREETNEYEMNAAVPFPPISSVEDFNYYNEFKDFEIHNSMYFFKLEDNKIIDIANNLGISNVTNQDDLYNSLYARKSVADLLKNRFLVYFSKYTKSDFNLHEIYVGGKNQITSTIDFDLIPNKKTGLHVDNWDKLPIAHLEKAKNRICINLGKSHRYFLFVYESVMEMKNKVAHENDKYRECENSNEIAKYFLMNDKSVKICYFKLNPYEGYIAPTENLIHDASNFDSDQTDIQITARGFFSPSFLNL